MRTIFKDKILDQMSREISLAEMNCKIISHFIITIEECNQLRHELKCDSRWKDNIDGGKIYGILVKVED